MLGNAKVQPPSVVGSFCLKEAAARKYGGTGTEEKARILDKPDSFKKVVLGEGQTCLNHKNNK